MIITYFGKEFVKISQGEMVIAMGPISKSSKSYSGTKFGSDIALLSVNHPDYNGVGELKHGEREPFVVFGPGDYEVKEIFIKGVASESTLGGKKYINTIYSLSVDNINIAYLGALGSSDISKEAREVIDGPDIIFTPVGGDLLSPKEAAKLALSFEPKLIIPMDYDAASLKAFLKELGEEKAESTDKLVLKRKDLDGKEGEVAVLKIS